MYPILLDQLARDHHDDLLRDAGSERLARLCATSPTPAVRSGRRRLGLLLVAAGTRLISPPGQPC